MSCWARDKCVTPAITGSPSLWRLQRIDKESGADDRFQQVIAKFNRLPQGDCPVRSMRSRDLVSLCIRPALHLLSLWLHVLTSYHGGRRGI